MPCQEACRLENTIDVLINSLEQFGSRVGMSNQDLSVRAQSYKGLPASVYEWTVTYESAYATNFGTVLACVRERLASQRTVAGQSRAGQLSEVGSPL